MWCGEQALDRQVAELARTNLLGFINGYRQGRPAGGNYQVDSVPARPSAFALTSAGGPSTSGTLVNNVKKLEM